MLPEFAPQMYVSSAKYFSGKTLLRLRTENKPKAVNADYLKKRTSPYRRDSRTLVRTVTSSSKSILPQSTLSPLAPLSLP